jgi:hypothetical protein
MVKAKLQKLTYPPCHYVFSKHGESQIVCAEPAYEGIAHYDNYGVMVIDAFYCSEHINHGKYSKGI